MHDSWLMYNEFPVVDRLQRCANYLSYWSRTHCNMVRKDITECKKQLEAHCTNQMGVHQNQSLYLRKEMQQLLLQDDTYWRQRAESFWYKDGDHNTKIFHASATSRKKVNRILSLEDDHGVKFSNNGGMCNVAKNYFLELFQKKNSVLDLVLDTIPQSITHDDNEQLSNDYFFDASRQMFRSARVQPGLLSTFLESV